MAMLVTLVRDHALTTWFVTMPSPASVKDSKDNHVRQHTMHPVISQQLFLSCHHPTTSSLSNPLGLFY